MIVCNNNDDYDILLSLRSHGWARNLKNKNIMKKYNKIDNRFIFLNSGFNLRLQKYKPQLQEINLKD